MLSVALTGGIASGKSLVAACLAEATVPICEADDLARAVLERGGEAYAEVVRAFGPGILRADGEIDRAALARIVFADARCLQRLNAITHPPVLQRLYAWREAAGRTAPLVVAVIPLLYEVHEEGRWDRVICVAAPESAQLERLRQRGLSAAEARQRLAAQWPLHEKMERADYVIYNAASRELLRAQTRMVLSRLRGD